MTWPQRAFLRMLQTVFKAVYGNEVAFAEELVRLHGIFGYVQYARSTYPVWFSLEAEFGERTANLVASFASFWNGCDYCAHGHLLAHNLLYFRDEGQLFPLDEREVFGLLKYRDGAIIDLLRVRLAAPPHQHLLQLLVRQYELKFRLAQPDTGMDKVLLRSIGFYDLVNECSIMYDGPAPPLSPIGRDKALIQRYESARAAQPDPAGGSRAS